MSDQQGSNDLPAEDTGFLHDLLEPLQSLDCDQSRLVCRRRARAGAAVCGRAESAGEARLRQPHRLCHACRRRRRLGHDPRQCGAVPPRRPPRPDARKSLHAVGGGERGGARTQRARRGGLFLPEAEPGGPRARRHAAATRAAEREFPRAVDRRRSESGAGQQSGCANLQFRRAASRRTPRRSDHHRRSRDRARRVAAAADDARS